MTRELLTLLLVLAFSVNCQGPAQEESADLVLLNGKIVTMDPANPEVEALTVPGLIDGHGHFMSLGSSLMGLDLRDAATWDEIVALVEEAVQDAEPGEWIEGRAILDTEILCTIIGGEMKYQEGDMRNLAAVF